MSIFKLPLAIELDVLQSRYDHLHHAKALTLLEQGRIALLEKIGQPIDTLFQAGLGLVITHIDISYKRELRSEDVVITCDTGEIQGKVIRLSQRILNSKGKVAVEAIVSSAFMSIHTRRGLEVPDDFRDDFEAWRSMPDEVDNRPTDR